MASFCVDIIKFCRSSPVGDQTQERAGGSLHSILDMVRVEHNPSLYLSSLRLIDCILICCTPNYTIMPAEAVISYKRPKGNSMERSKTNAPSHCLRRLALFLCASFMRVTAFRPPPSQLPSRGRITTTTILFQSSSSSPQPKKSPRKRATTTTSVRRKRRRAGGVPDEGSSSSSSSTFSGTSGLTAASSSSKAQSGKSKKDEQHHYFYTKLAEHELLTKEEEFELGTAIQRSLRLQEKLNELVTEKQKQLQEQAEEQRESEDEWFSLMGEGYSKPFYDSDDDFGDDALSELSVLDLVDDDDDDDVSSMAHNDDIVGSRQLPQPKRIRKQYLRDCDLDILSTEEILRFTGLSRIQVKSILLQGAFARDKLIRHNIKLVISIAKKWVRQNSRGANLRQAYAGGWDRPSLEEAIQEGIQGLCRAADKFNPGRDLKFSTYATFWITSKVRACFQRATTPGIRLQPLFYDIRSRYKSLIHSKLLQSKDIPPFDEIAKELNLKPERLQMILKVTTTAVSIDGPVFKGFTSPGKAAGGEENTMTLADTLVDYDSLPEDGVDWSFLRQSLENAMANELDPYERDIIRLRLGLDDGFSRTVKEVVGAFGGQLSATYIRTSEKRAFSKLRSPHSLASYQFMAYLDLVGIDGSKAALD